MDLVKEFKRSDEKVVRIFQDTDPMDPLENADDSPGKMYCWHRNYNLGHAHNFEQPFDLLESLFNDSDFKPTSDIGSHRTGKDMLISLLESVGYVIVPLYLYDHSGITMSTSKFSCPWDSGQVGVYVITPERVQAEWGGDESKARDYVEAVVREYDDYLTGNVYGFQVGTVDDNGYFVDVDDSCWGFYGDDFAASGLLEAAAGSEVLTEN